MFSFSTCLDFILLQLSPENLHQGSLHLLLRSALAFPIRIPSNSLVQCKFRFSQTKHLFLDRPFCDELHDIYVSFLTNPIRSVLRLTVVVGIEILVEPISFSVSKSQDRKTGMEDEHDHNGCRSQIDAHPTCFGGQQEYRDALVLGELVDECLSDVHGSGARQEEVFGIPDFQDSLENVEHLRELQRLRSAQGP